jgi:hypothetical protein
MTATAHDLVKAVDYARKAKGSSPFVGIANGQGTMMFLRHRMKATLKGLDIVDVEVGPYESNGNAQSYPWKCERALIVHAKSPDGRVKSKRVFIPEKTWKMSTRLTSWQRTELRKMGRCDCWPFHDSGTCAHVERHRQPKLDKYQKAIAKLEKQIPREWRPGNPAVAECSREPASADHRRDWMLWRVQKDTRRAVMALAIRTGWKHSHRTQVKADLNSTKLYVELAKLTAQHYTMTNHDDYFNRGDRNRVVVPEYALGSWPLKVTKWGEITEYARRKDNLGSLWDYIAQLWRYCGLAGKPHRDDWRDEQSYWGARHYQQWLKDLWERRQLQEQIAAIRAEAGGGADDNSK